MTVEGDRIVSSDSVLPSRPDFSDAEVDPDLLGPSDSVDYSDQPVFFGFDDFGFLASNYFAYLLHPIWSHMNRRCFWELKIKGCLLY